MPRVSLDFIFGVAGQTAEQAAAEASTLAGVGTTHLSAYALTIEPGTEFGARAKKGRLPLLDDATVADSFLAVDGALERAGYDVASFANGADAYARLMEEPFTLLLTDIVMPRMDGIELARRASEIDPDLKIMFITGFAAVVLNNADAAPKDARVLSKPFHLKDLVREVERLLAA